MNSPLGQLQRVELRTIWQTEDCDFTPWLAQEENLAILGKTIGIDELEHEATEKEVGPFRADILCKAFGDQFVLIENQLEQTDHKHLGQLLTYAAGLNAATIVWIASPFTDEHRATLDWLNEVTNDDLHFFGLEIELWRIGDSVPAPKFNIISKPNDWTKSVSKGAKSISEKDLSETKKRNYEYWLQFFAILENTNSPVKPRKARPQHWTYFGIGRSGFQLGATINTQAKKIGVELYITADESTAYFNLLMEEKENIENRLGVSILWQELPTRQACRLRILRENCDPTNQNAWPEYQAWMKDNLEKLNSIFRPLVSDLDASDWNPNDEVSDEVGLSVE
ncbi:MAG: DUF4268 domain-containing protein [Magnetococcales bacterium]|nr:DUF4268 domain-containing protein [Magnetococcales bacterium]